jgi:hypothetical protein
MPISRLATLPFTRTAPESPIYTSPQTSLYEGNRVLNLILTWIFIIFDGENGIACQIMLSHDLHRLPLVDQSANGCELILSVLSQSKVLRFIAINVRVYFVK